MPDEHRIDRDAFRDWCERQVDYSRSPTARIIVADADRLRFRIREDDDVEDILLLKGRDVDTVRFEKNDESRQFHAHRREFTFHEKTLIVRQPDATAIVRAGTSAGRQRGAFPV